MGIRYVSSHRLSEVSRTAVAPRWAPPPPKRPRSPPIDAPKPTAPELPEDMLCMIFTAVARAEDGGIPSVLAARSTCRSWRKAASRPELWQDIARKRWGYSEEGGTDDGGSDDEVRSEANATYHAEFAKCSDPNRSLSCQLATAPEACVNYTKGRWHRAVANIKRYKVTFVDVQHARLEQLKLRKHRAKHVALSLHSLAHPPATQWTPEYITKKFDNAEDPGELETLVSEISDGVALDGVGENTLGDGDNGNGEGISQFEGESARERSVIIDIRDPGSVVVTHHLLVLQMALTSPYENSLDGCSWRDISKRTHKGCVCVAIDAEVDDDETGDDQSGPKKKWQHLTQLWVRVGVSLTRAGPDMDDARLFLDGAAWLSHVAPSTFSKELTYFWAKANGAKEDERTESNNPFLTSSNLYKKQKTARIVYDEPPVVLSYNRFVDRSHDPRLPSYEVGDPCMHPILKGLRINLCAAIEREEKAASNPSHRSNAQVASRSAESLQNMVMELETDTERRMCRNVASKDLRAAAVPHDIISNLINEFSVSVSFTLDDELDEMFGGDGSASFHSVNNSITHAAAVVAPSLPIPRRFPNSSLATFRIGDGAAAAATRILEMSSKWKKKRKDKLAALRCHVSFTRKNGMGYVYATGLRCDINAIGSIASGSAMRSSSTKGQLSKAPAALHFSERHRHDALHGTRQVFADDKDVFQPIDEHDESEVRECRVAQIEWRNGADGWCITGDGDPHLSFDNTHAVQHRHTQLNWTMEPCDFVRSGLSNLKKSRDEKVKMKTHFSRLFLNAATVRDEFETKARKKINSVDRHETPTVVQLHEASVSIGHSLLLTVPLSALLKASGRDGSEIISGLEG